MSNQNVSTPREFIKAVEKYYGIKFKYDMAASEENHKAPEYFTEKDDSLSIDWPLDGWCWLNPTFINLTQWINKCLQQMRRGCKIISIWPLSGDLNQIPTYENATVSIIHGRIWPVVRGCMLCKWDLSDTWGLTINGLKWDKTELTEIWN